MFKRKSRNNTRKPMKALGRARSISSRLERQRVKKRPTAEKHSWQGWQLVRKAMGKLALAVAVLALVTGGLLGGYAALATSSTLAVSKAEVLGTLHLSRLEVLRAAGVGVHSNLASLRVGEIEQRVARLPWVRSAEVQRIWPDTVRITVEERRPRFLALADGEFYFLDRDLSAFALLDGEPAPDMVVFSGLTRADLAEPDPEIMELWRKTEDLLALLPKGDQGPAGGLSEIHLDRVWGLCLVFEDLPATVRLGRKDFARRLELLDEVRADLRSRGELERALLIDLSDQNRTVVRLRGEKA